MKQVAYTGAVLLLALGSACSSSSRGPSTTAPLCNAGEVSSALSRADSGDTVRIGACRVTGSFTVPAGVHLLGAGRGASVMVASGGAAITVAPGAASSIADLSIESNTVAAIASVGPGDLAIERVDVTATHGIGIGVEGATWLNLKDVKLTGPVTPSSAAAIPPEPTRKDTATHGLVLVRVANAALNNLVVTGFADYGALFVQSTTRWIGGSSSANLGTGLMADGGKVSLESVSLCGTLAGARKLPPYGAVLARADVTSKALTVCDNKGIGLLHLEGTAEHADLIGTGNGGPALWVERSASFALIGASQIKNNAYAGIVVIEAAKVHVKGAVFENNRNGDKPLGSAGAPTLGDGLQLVRSPRAILFENVTFTNNERSGLQLDLGPVDEDVADLTWSNVTAESIGAGFGALCQGDIEAWGPTDKWSTGIVRKGAAIVNDTISKVTQLTIAGIVGPPYIPSPVSVATSGLSVLTAP